MTIALRMVIRDEVLGADMRVANKEIHKDPNTTPAASDDIPLAWRRAIVIWKVVEESSKNTGHDFASKDSDCLHSAAFSTNF